jgi:AraC-like DNA-binding protein
MNYAQQTHNQNSAMQEQVQEQINNSRELHYVDQFRSFDSISLPLNGVTVYDLYIGGALSIEKAKEDICEDAENHVFLTTLISGDALIEHDNQEIKLQIGDLAIIEGKLPYRITYTGQSERIALRIPLNLFKDRIVARQDNEFKSCVLPNTGLVPVVVNLFKSLALESDKLNETDRFTLTNTLLELMGTVIRSTTHKKGTIQHRNQAKLMCRILAYMDENYSDCELTPEKVAKANGISMRYLHRLFQQSGMGVSKWIWDRRLKASREDLLDPAKAAMRISEVAFARGFNDPAHFSRSFRDKFGISPSELRRKVNH